MVELRKRKDPPAGNSGAPLVKKPSSAKLSNTSIGKKETSSKNASSLKKVAVGDTIDLDNFGGEIETNDGVKTSLKKLVEESKTGVVLFTYPKASTPGCTTQACLFRDEFEQLTSTGLSIYGLSTDSPKSNSTFKAKQNLPYTLLCDPKATLIGAIGMKKVPSGTTRGVFAVNKNAQVEASEPGGPAATVEVIRKVVGAGKVLITEKDKPSSETALSTKVPAGDAVRAEVAAEVADTAQKLDVDSST